MNADSISGARKHCADAPEIADYLADAETFSTWIAHYLSGSLDQMPVTPRVRPGALAAALDVVLPDEGAPLRELFAEFVRDLLPGVTQWNHPGFFGYFPSSAGPPGVLGEYLTAALNQQAMLWRSSPMASEVEARALDWLRGLLGLPAAYTGVAYDGGSMANLHGLLAARQVVVAGVRTWGLTCARDIAGYRVYASAQAHSSITKAVIVLGLGEHALCSVSCDRDGRLDVEALREAIATDRTRGLLPIAVVATAGTTSCGALDPLADIAALCREQGIWLHVDAAWAGAAAMLPECAPLFFGIEQADSVVVDPHKWLFTPIDLGVCYFRNLAPLTDALALQPAYLRHAEDEAELNLMDRGIALGRRCRGLKLWFVLKHYGADGLRARLREHLRLARLFADAVDSHPYLQRVTAVGFSLVCFRAVLADLADDRTDVLNRAMLNAINDRGAVFLSATEVNGRFVLRCAIGHLRTGEAHVALVVQEIDEVLAVLLEHGAP